jgi:hypothetical protein
MPPASGPADLVGTVSIGVPVEHLGDLPSFDVYCPVPRVNDEAIPPFDVRKADDFPIAPVFEREYLPDDRQPATD